MIVLIYTYCEKWHFRLLCLIFRKRERKGEVERIHLKIKIEEICFELLSSDFVRYSHKLIVVFRLVGETLVCGCTRVLLRSQSSFPSFLGARKIFSAISSRGSVATIRSRAADNGREPSENFTRTMSSWVYHLVGYELAIVYHSLAGIFHRFVLRGKDFQHLSLILLCLVPRYISELNHFRNYKKNSICM